MQSIANSLLFSFYVRVTLSRKKPLRTILEEIEEGLKYSPSNTCTRKRKAGPKCFQESLENRSQIAIKTFYLPMESTLRLLQNESDDGNPQKRPKLLQIGHPQVKELKILSLNCVFLIFWV